MSGSGPKARPGSNVITKPHAQSTGSVNNSLTLREMQSSSAGTINSARSEVGTSRDSSRERVEKVGSASGIPTAVKFATFDSTTLAEKSNRDSEGSVASSSSMNRASGFLSRESFHADPLGSIKRTLGNIKGKNDSSSMNSFLIYLNSPVS
jgi:hypothetical protein